MVVVKLLLSLATKNIGLDETLLKVRQLVTLGVSLVSAINAPKWYLVLLRSFSFFSSVLWGSAISLSC